MATGVQVGLDRTLDSWVVYKNTPGSPVDGGIGGLEAADRMASETFLCYEYRVIEVINDQDIPSPFECWTFDLMFASSPAFQPLFNYISKQASF